MQTEKITTKLKDYTTKNNQNFFCKNNFKDYTTDKFSNTKVATAINKGAVL